MDRDGLTESERAIMDLTAEVWNRFIELPQLHTSEVPEFHRKLHDLQRFVLARPALRAMRDIFDIQAVP